MPVYEKPRPKPRLAMLLVTAERVVAKFQDTQEEISFLPDDVPAHVKDRLIYNVTMNDEQTRIYYANPKPSSSYFCKFEGFVRKRGDDGEELAIPNIRNVETKRYPGWTNPAHQEFTATFTINSGEYAGVPIPLNLNWVFSRHESGQIMIGGNGMKKVKNFMIACGIDFENDDLPFQTTQEDTLLMLEKALLDRNQEVIIALNDKGYVDSLTPAPQK